MKSETENTIKAFITEDGTVYTPCETSEAEGLWSNGKFIEGRSYLSSTWQLFGAILVKKTVPKKEPLVWTGEQKVLTDDFDRAMVLGPSSFLRKRVAVEVREITEPELAPELDLSPLTKEEFWQLQPLDTVTVPELDGLVTIRQKDEAYWGFRGEHNALPAFVKCNDRCSPTPETAKRLRGKVTK